MDQDLAKHVAYYLERLGGPDDYNAYHRLIESPATAIPLLISAYALEASTRKKALIIEVIEHFRNPKTYDFFAAALEEDDPVIWKQALDGLVTLGGNEALEVLRKRLPAKPDAKKREWILEAIEQISNP